MQNEASSFTRRVERQRRIHIRPIAVTLILIACGAKSTPVAPSASTAGPAVPDAVQTNPEKYRVVLENDRVRVLDYLDHPGEKTQLHHHPAFVLHALGPFQRRLHFADGSAKDLAFKGGETVFMPAQTHTGENTGTTDTHVLIVELK